MVIMRDQPEVRRAPTADNLARMCSVPSAVAGTSLRSRPIDGQPYRRATLAEPCEFIGHGEGCPSLVPPVDWVPSYATRNQIRGPAGSDCRLPGTHALRTVRFRRDTLLIGTFSAENKILASHQFCFTATMLKQLREIRSARLGTVSEKRVAP